MRADDSLASPAAKTQAARARVTNLADVEARPVSWLWPGFIPHGMLTVLDGDPGLGKSTLLLDIAARLSTGGCMPDGSATGTASTVILSHEDDLARVIRPRLDAAGADCSCVCTMAVSDGDAERDLVVEAEDLGLLEETVIAKGARLVIIDPLVAYLPSGINANSDQDVRRALAPLRDLAERTGAALVVIRHLRKSAADNAIYRGGGSIGIIGAARAGLLVAPDPDDALGERRILAPNKMNLCKKLPSRAFRLHAEAGDQHPRVLWEGTSDHTASTLLAVPQGEEERGALHEAESFLRDALAHGSRPFREVDHEARALGIAGRTLKRARRKLGVVAEKRGRSWEMRLPKAANLPPTSGIGPLERGDAGTTQSEQDLVEGGQGCLPPSGMSTVASLDDAAPAFPSEEEHAAATRDFRAEVAP